MNHSWRTAKISAVSPFTDRHVIHSYFNTCPESPDGKCFVTDGKVVRRTHGQPDDWGIAVGSTSIDDFVLLTTLDNSQGAKTWRHNHPHPTLSADGRRIYFNVNDGLWTQLMVAERGA